MIKKGDTIIVHTLTTPDKESGILVGDTYTVSRVEESTNIRTRFYVKELLDWYFFEDQVDKFNTLSIVPEQNRIKIDITLTIGDIGHVLTIKEAKQIKTALEALV